MLEAVILYQQVISIPTECNTIQCITTLNGKAIHGQVIHVIAAVDTPDNRWIGVAMGNNAATATHLVMASQQTRIIETHVQAVFISTLGIIPFANPQFNTLANACNGIQQGTQQTTCILTHENATATAGAKATRIRTGNTVGLVSTVAVNENIRIRRADAAADVYTVTAQVHRAALSIHLSLNIQRIIRWLAMISREGNISAASEDRCAGFQTNACTRCPVTPGIRNQVATLCFNQTADVDAAITAEIRIS